MKKFTVILLSFVICFTFFGCSADSPANITGTSITESTTKNTTVSELTGTLADDTQNKSTTEKSGQKSTTSKSTTQSTSSTAKTTIQATTKRKSTTKSTTTATKKSATQKQTTTSSTVTCTVAVECKSILENMDDLKAGHESFVPSDGVIMRSTSVTVKNGSTAYDALKTACDKQGVTISVKNSAYGKYILGFNNIDEKDCGSQSGWTYTVNSKSIWQSCDKYVIKDGDCIEFSFVCKY